MTHIYGDQGLVEWFNDNNIYDNNGDGSGKKVCIGFLNDLAYESPRIADAARQRELVYDFDITLGSDLLDWEIDLVVGPAPEPRGQLSMPDWGTGDTVLPKENVWEQQTPKEVWLAADPKSLMLSHTNNRKNRTRTLLSMGMHVDQIFPEAAGDNPPVSEDALAIGFMVVNTASEFKKPQSDAPSPNPDHVEQLAKETTDLLALAADASDSLQAIAAIVLSYTNTCNDADLREDDIAPQPGDSTHYRTVVKRMADQFESRFLMDQVEASD